MASRRKPAVIRRIIQKVEASPDELVVASVDVKREPTESPEAMSPDSNHNLQCPGQRGGLPEMEITMKLVKSEPQSSEDDSSQERDPKIQEYLGRTDTAVVFPEDPAGLQDNVPLSGGPKDRASPADLQDDCYIKCSFCGQGLSSFQALKEHVDASHPGGAFPCVHCAATFPSRDQLEKHEQLHPNTQQVSCKVCNKTFANVYRLQRHMISHDESAVLRKFKCPECDKAFKFKHHLKEHIRIHSGEKPFKCNNCGKRFSHSGSYSSHMTSKKCLVMNLKVNQRNLNRAVDLKHQNPVHLSGFSRNPLPIMKRSPTTNNNNNFPPILPKYNEAAAAFFNSFPQQNTNSGIHSFFFPTFNPSQNTPFGLQSSLNNLIEHFNKTPPPNHSDVIIKEVRERENQSPQKEEVTIKEEVKDDGKDEEDQNPSPHQSQHPNQHFSFSERHSSAESNSGDLDEVKKILDTVNAKVTKQFFQENIQKLSPASCSSECPSVGSGAATPPVEEQMNILSCRFCHKTFTSGIDLHQHERYRCHGDDEKSEGLAAKLEDVATKTEANGVSCSGSEDETRGSRELMTEDEDGDTIDQDGRKVRVRSQISEDQLIILKQNYTLNPRPKREELSRIADQVGLAVRVVQVWFQNNRARDRREGRLVHVPYVPPNSWFPADSPPIATEQPLDLSTKKSQGSSPACSPPRSDSEEAVNLTQKPQLFIRPLFQQRSPSPLDSSRLARMLTQPALRFPPNGGTLGASSMERLLYTSPEHSSSRSPLPAIALYNSSSSPSQGSEFWWKRNLMETPEADEFMYNSDDAIKRPKMATEPDSDGQLYSCDQCDKAFSKQSSLARHRYEHSGQRPHKCDVCLKAFKHKHHLTEHKRLHSGEKPFQCSKCLKRFSHSGSYSQHMNHRYSYCKPYRE